MATKRSVLSPNLFEDFEDIFPLVKDEEEERFAKRTLRSYNIVRFIASGSYNCAHLVRNHDGSLEVLRVAFLPFQEEQFTANDRVRRGLEIVNIFQPFGTLLGPSLLKQTQAYEIVSEISSEGLCNNILRELAKADHLFISYEFAIQHLEYLNGGNFKSTADMTIEEADFCTFSLIWFLRQAQLNFDFRHRDLKPENIVLRRHQISDVYEFYTDVNLFRFVSTVVPVIIDFDFATVLTSKSKYDRRVVGTRYTASPDSLIYLLFRYVKIKIDPKESAASFQSYDWWSLGIILFEVHVPRYLLPLQRIDFQLYNVCREECNAYAMRKIREFQLKFNNGDELPNANDMLEIFKRIMFGTMIAAIVHGSEKFGPPLETKSNYPFTKFFFYHNEQDAAAIQKTRIYKILVGAFAAFPAHLQGILKLLLSWDPEKRKQSVEEYFTKIYGNNSESDAMEDETKTVFVFSDEFEDARVFDKAMDVKTFPLLQNKI
jgi:serine/threonine protein kinase